jgi:LCP family protein required for cell wall assembly
MTPDDEQRPKGRPDYKVYRSRPRLSDRLRKRDLGSLRKQGAEKDGPEMRRYRSGGGGGGFLRGLRRGGGGGGRRPWWKWVLYACGVWVLISILAFMISAQIQTGKLSDAAKNELSGGPALLAGQNILVLGGDQRSAQVGGNDPGASLSAPPRADTIMVIHAGLTSFRKLSIPRDTYASIPGHGDQKINGGFSATGDKNGDAALMIKTVKDFLGINIDHLIIVDFNGFVDFINAVGGVKVNLPKRVCGEVSGGKKNGGVTIHLKAGEHTLQGDKALALARIRENTCVPSETDLQRAARQQLIISGIKNRLTDPLRFPINFLKGPLIGWTAPKALITDMGAFTLPQLAVASVFGGNPTTNVLKPSSSGPGGSLVVPKSQCIEAVKRLIGGNPDREPACSP